MFKQMSLVQRVRLSIYSIELGQMSLIECISLLDLDPIGLGLCLREKGLGKKCLLK